MDCIVFYQKILFLYKVEALTEQGYLSKPVPNHPRNTKYWQACTFKISSFYKCIRCTQIFYNNDTEKCTRKIIQLHQWKCKLLNSCFLWKFKYKMNSSYRMAMHIYKNFAHLSLSTECANFWSSSSSYKHCHFGTG